MKTKQAKEIIVSLSAPSKMPCKSYSLPASECKVGSKLRKKSGSVCADCYAHKGCYAWSNVQNVLHKRLESISNPQWVNAMQTLIGQYTFFRWHDSGDLQGMRHFKKIIDVCNKTPNTRHWLPTKEKALLKRFIKGGGTIPANLNIRLSGFMVDGSSPSVKGMRGVNTSTVHDTGKAKGIECKAFTHGNECGTCRACWDKTVKNISYRKH